MDKPQLVKNLLVDGDIIAYRAAFSGETERLAMAKVDDLMTFIIDKTLVFSTGNDYTSFLTGKGNFRYDVAVTAEYKGNRKKTERPIFLDACRERIVDRWNGVVIEGQEADDAIGIAATNSDPETTVIASIDKDMKQLSCWHFNFSTGEYAFVTPDEGNRSFYKQMLTGDTADNIKGLHRVGPAKAEKILGDSKTPQELYKSVLDAYDGDTTRVLENGRLLWLRRSEGQMWEPPE